jgi:hypothetical protein
MRIRFFLDSTPGEAHHPKHSYRKKTISVICHESGGDYFRDMDEMDK